MFFRADDGILVVADGREVNCPVGGTPEWRSDDARKLTKAVGENPVIAAAVGLAAVGAGDAAVDVLDVLNSVLASPRPSTGLAAGAGPWTAKAVAIAARDAADELIEGVGMTSEVQALVVDWQVDAAGPVMWAFDLTPMPGMTPEELGDDPPAGRPMQVVGTSASPVTDFPVRRFACIPRESSVWELLRAGFDRTVELDATDADFDDPRWELPAFTLGGLDLDQLSIQVEALVGSALARDSDALRRSHVGGNWIFGHLRPGVKPRFETRRLGPPHVDGSW